MNVNWNPDWRRPENMRANLPVTFGCRAGQMAAHGRISIPYGTGGEDLLAALGRAVVNEWELWLDSEVNNDDVTRNAIAEEWDIIDPDVVTVDEFIETALFKHFPLGKEWNL